MGSCVSRSPASTSAPGSGRAVATKTAKVVDVDGSMAQFTAPITAGEVLGSVQERRPGASVFLCSSDELRFDVPARALAAEEALQPGWLYFVLPVSTLRRSLSGPEMAALAARASSALAVASGVASPPRRKNGARVPGGNSKRRKAAARVAPLVVADEIDGRDGGSDRHHAYGKHGGDEPAGKARKGTGWSGSRSSTRRRRRASVTPTLSSILEADDF
ncbi:hypothetical protein D1007_32593 [Hordeum vulgare]|uniref:Uncharacterized protein n=1 Tax=Hordeum vulgare subsp. vulgare TaxID=112509 RepID=A0A8I6XZW4_HORVV|nr:uncharacterized protein LOC123397594 [Hordeum vulgare subsp. vulgare]KAE8792819.1 hypothetical protein D1007_32593 [Hordeum vulgare]